jgi:hypothetical protein
MNKKADDHLSFLHVKKHDHYLHLTPFKNAFILIFITLLKFTDVINIIKKW